MKKFINIIEKASRIKNAFKSVVRGGEHKEHNEHHEHDHNQHHEIELDDQNDSSNWTYN
jgi:hypothetical protein